MDGARLRRLTIWGHMGAMQAPFFFTFLRGHIPVQTFPTYIAFLDIGRIRS